MKVERRQNICFCWSRNIAEKCRMQIYYIWRFISATLFHVKLLGQEIIILPQIVCFDLVMNFRTKSELKLYVLPSSTIQSLGLQSSFLVWLLRFKPSIKEHFKQISMSQTPNPVLRFKFFKFILGIISGLLFLSLFFCLFLLLFITKDKIIWFLQMKVHV